MNRQVYKVGESLNQIKLCHLVQSKKLQVENNKELLQFLHIENVLCIMFKITAFFIIKLFTLLYVRVVILLTRGKQLNGRIISLRGKALDPYN